MLIVVVMLVGDIIFGSIVLYENVHQRWRFALFGSSSLDLTGRASDTKFESRREVVAIGWTEVVARRQNQLRGRYWGGLDGRAVNGACSFLSEVGRVGVGPKCSPGGVSVRVVGISR